jgi:hypothetical protein
MNRNVRFLLAIAAIAAMVVMTGNAVQAATITDTWNFESPVLSSGSTTALDTTVWSKWRTGQPLSDCVIVNPTSAQFSQVDPLAAPCSGNQCLWCDVTTSADVYLVATSADIKVYSSATYTITCPIGAALNQTFDGSDLGFASSTGKWSVDSNGSGYSHVHPTAGGWALQTFTTTGALIESKGKATEGSALEILLSPSDGCFMEDVTVTATGQVPEPSTLVLLSTGLIGLVAYAWRKRR